MPIAIVVIIAIAAIGYYAFQSQKKGSAAVTPTPVAQQNMQTGATQAPAGVYKDGTYTATGNYVTPGGARAVDVTLTLKGGVITDSTFVGKATDPTTKRFQTEFGNNYKPMVVGKNIDEVSLTKVSGSSLTSKGFTDALDKIKAQAKG